MQVFDEGQAFFERLRSKYEAEVEAAVTKYAETLAAKDALTKQALRAWERGHLRAADAARLSYLKSEFGDCAACGQAVGVSRAAFSRMRRRGLLSRTTREVADSRFGDLIEPVDPIAIWMSGVCEVVFELTRHALKRRGKRISIEVVSSFLLILISPNVKENLGPGVPHETVDALSEIACKIRNQPFARKRWQVHPLCLAWLYSEHLEALYLSIWALDETGKT